MSDDSTKATKAGTKLVPAAGAVLWRGGEDAIGAAVTEVAVIHRPRYDDWSLPKGKVELDETDPVAAVREVHEETGYTAQLGRRLGSISYDIPQGTKRVWYWAARAAGGDFTPNDEVDKLIWLPVDAAIPARLRSHSIDSPSIPRREMRMVFGVRRARSPTTIVSGSCAIASSRRSRNARTSLFILSKCPTDCFIAKPIPMM